MTAEDPGLAQDRASDPAHSVWVVANAGSGKTKVLTDRVARLLLAGVDPGSILCLTYTKAAAAEMQVRLFRRLGSWAMMEDADLAAALAALGAGPQRAAGLARARRLFAQAVETPGGLRIQTIHSFCAALLRRFPLEAGVAPGFVELDDRGAARLRAEVLDEIAGTLAPAAMADLAEHWTGADIDRLLAQIAGLRDAFPAEPDAAAIRRACGVRQGDNEALVLADTFLGGEADLVAEVVAVMAGSAKPTDRENADRLAALDLSRPTLRMLEALEDLFVYGPKTQTFPDQAKLGRFPTKESQKALGRQLDALQAFMRRVEAAKPRRGALLAAERTLALHGFAAAFLPAYAARKAAMGWLDFDDLILTARRLLTDPAVAPFVLWRLDGGIAHILVDEAQDTSPAQWAVVEALTEEFTSGAGAADGRGRTLFVVGDRKQSIYSFQGADLDIYDARRRGFLSRMAAAGMPMREVPLLHSFRSAPAILRLTDSLTGPGGMELEGTPHVPFFAGMPGRVELWPVQENAAGDGADPDSGDVTTGEEAEALLARRIAARIGEMIASGTQVPLRRADGGARAMTAGDVLILLRKRSRLFHAILRACKAAGLPVAGADRVKLSEELAVNDIRATLAFVALPEDDLSLAAALRSPLFGLSERELYRLAQGRDGSLWDRLRTAADPASVAATRVLQDLRDRSDFLRPYDLIDRLLTRHGGRRRLLARLGAEAEDAIDVLCAEALAYETAEVPSLTGFLAWLDSGDVEVKRPVAEGGGAIRVMTIHGAKGLEAPVVILPDTTAEKSPPQDPLLRLPTGTVGWSMAADQAPPVLREALSLRAAQAEAESQRLLYVAVTRAESLLVVAGLAPASRKKEEADKPPYWYQRLRKAMESCGAVPTADGGLELASGHWPDLALAVADRPELDPGLPDWALHPAGTARRPPRPVSPSALGGAKALAGEGDDTATAQARGTAIHRLLELLPGLPGDRAAALAVAVGADPAMLAEAQAVLSAPALAPLFAPGALVEVDLSATLAGQPLRGAIDRLVLAPDHVLAVDFKTNRIVPERVEDVPEGLLRQMGAYAEALAQVFPGRRIDTAILWTRTAQLMPLPHDIVRVALSRATIP
jgi:ATP-dependent helicase/nuclease subunit A